MRRSARFSSLRGVSSEGWTTAIAALSGKGATIFLTGAVFSGDHSTTRGTGTFLNVTRSAGRSGCNKVCGAGISFAVCWVTKGEPAEPPPEVGWCAAACGLAIGPGYSTPAPAACRVCGSVLCKSRTRTANRLLGNLSMMWCFSMILAVKMPKQEACSRIEITNGEGNELGRVGSEKSVIIGEFPMLGLTPSLTLLEHS